MNKVMDPQKTARTMQEFSKQNAKMEMTEEMSESFDYYKHSIFKKNNPSLSVRKILNIKSCC